MKHIISVLVENKFGVLARIAGLFSARGYNIDSLAVGETHDPSVSCMTIVVNAADEKILEQIKKQLNKLIDVVTVTDITKKDYIERELLLIKIECNVKIKSELKKIAAKYEIKIDESKTNFVIFEATLDQAQEKKLLEDLEKYNIKELVRTGRIAIGK